MNKAEEHETSSAFDSRIAETVASPSVVSERSRSAAAGATAARQRRDGDRSAQREDRKRRLRRLPRFGYSTLSSARWSFRKMPTLWDFGRPWWRVLLAPLPNRFYPAV
jgi:hypothetical protein